MKGDRLVELRKERHLTQTAFGNLFNISKRAVYTYEKGKSEPSNELLVAMAQYFGVTTDYLMGNSRNEKQEYPFLIDTKNNSIRFAKNISQTKWRMISKLLKFVFEENDD